MNKADRKRFAEIMTGMADNFRDTITPEGLQMRFDMLSEYSINQIEQASRKIIFTRKYMKMPPIAEFIEAMENKPKIEDNALLIANNIISHLQREGAGVFPDLNGDEIAMHLMSRRWPYRTWGARLLDSETKWWIKEFCEAYTAMSKSENRLFLECPEYIKSLIKDTGNSGMDQINN